MNSSPSKAAAFRKYEYKKLCYLTGFCAEQLDSVLKTVDTSYRSWSEEKINKKTGLVKTYKDGTIKKRTYRSPSVLLKEIQSRINKNIFSKIVLLPNVQGGVKKKSNLTNAKKHQGNKYLFATDLQEFYPNIKHNHVYDALIGLDYSPHMAHWLSRLTTKDNEVPQGAPTSTAVSNLVFYQTDVRLAAFCNEHGITYTRYIDDLTFSSPHNFAHLVNELLSVVSTANFKINYRKTDYDPDQLITGIKIYLYKIDGSDKIIEKAREELLNDKPVKAINNYLNRIRETNMKKDNKNK